MEQLFNPQLPDGERPDIQVCIFPHLTEFLAIDTRGTQPRVHILNTAQIFTEDFFKCVEAEFSAAIRETTDYPFAHFVNLPLRMEEAVRETAMSFILEQLGVNPEEDEQLPTVVVFLITGGVLTSHAEQVLDSLKQVFSTESGSALSAEWEEVLSRLVAQEHDILQKLNRQELAEAVRVDTPDYFTLWDNRN